MSKRYGFHMTTAGGNVMGTDHEVTAPDLATAIRLAEAENPGFNVVRGRCLDNYDDGSARSDIARDEFKANVRAIRTAEATR